jgi:hypothetical protein
VPTGPGGCDAALSVRGLTVSYAEKPAVFSVDATFRRRCHDGDHRTERRRQIHLLKACLGIVPRLSGEVEVFGQPVERARHRIAYVPQRASVDWDFPATVLDVVKMGLYRTVGPVRAAVRRGRIPVRGPVSTASAWPISPTARSASCPAASSSACSSPGRWRRTPISTCWTSLSPVSTPPRNAPSSMC